MNYDHLNQVYDYWRKDIFPHLEHHFHAVSFEDYLKRFAYLPSGKWIRDSETVKLSRVGFAIDPKKFVTKYKAHCVTYNAPAKPEEGVQRVIYQMSPTLHLEMAVWIWVEHDNLQAYSSVFICYNDRAEYTKFMDELYKIRRTGNTEDKQVKAGFLGMIDDSK